MYLHFVIENTSPFGERSIRASWTHILTSLQMGMKTYRIGLGCNRGRYSPDTTFKKAFFVFVMAQTGNDLLPEKVVHSKREKYDKIAEMEWK